jgi:hypothetical protein
MRSSSVELVYLDFARDRCSASVGLPDTPSDVGCLSLIALDIRVVAPDTISIDSTYTNVLTLRRRIDRRPAHDWSIM